MTSRGINPEKDKAYFKAYYKKNKAQFAAYKRLDYWRKIYASLVNRPLNEIVIIGFDESKLKEMVKTLRECKNV